MLSQAENELLTRTDRGAPCGELMRRYWQPAALAEELPADGPPLPLRLLGEDLVLFRDQQGRPGLLGLHCSHRGADLSYGRLEDGGIRCIYHGWLYDIQGRCLEQPGEPAESMMKHTIRHTAYPCQEIGGLILAYLGPGEPPQAPAYEFLTAADEHRFASKVFHDCNYLQGNEGNLDQAHLSFLHLQFRPRDSEEHALYQADRSPRIEPEETDYGLRIFNVREAGPDSTFIKISNFIFPNFGAFPGGAQGDGYTVNWHVPIDDTHHWKYVVQFRRNQTLDPETQRRSRSELAADYHPIRNKTNRYLQDREEMKSDTFAGLGFAFQSQDCCAVEGAGPIQDRTEEHLGVSDRAVVASRKLLLQAIRDVQEGRDPPHVVRDPAANVQPEIVVRAEVIPSSVDYRTYWKSTPPQSVLARA